MSAIELVLSTYADCRIKKTFKVTMDTLKFILIKIYEKLLKETVAEEPVSLECRLGITLYRLARGDCYYTLAYLTGLGEATVCLIVIDICQIIVQDLWNDHAYCHFPHADAVKNVVISMDAKW